MTKDGGIIKIYIKRDQNEIKYIDIATAIAVAVIHEPIDEQIMSIQYKLSTSLEELESVGYHVNSQQSDGGKIAYYLPFVF